MASLVESRGPDDSGEWTDPDAGMALGYRRLAIIDLSPGGRQPMVSVGGDLVIAYNGELFRRRWDEHQSGVRNWQYPLWTVLMAQAWRRRWLGPPPPRRRNATP